MTYAIDLDAMTVTITHGTGERFDLNATGEPCRSTADLRAFVRELYAQGVYGRDIRDALLLDIP